MNFKDDIKEYIELEKKVLSELDTDELNASMNALIRAYDREANIYIFGNGGSASTASHFANDFNKGISEKLDKKFNCICLNDNVPIITAIANDISYEEIFRFQLRGKLKKSDLIIAISGSGNSKNVVNALSYAKEIGTEIIAITGFDGGEAKKIADYSMHARIDSMPMSEDIHMMFDHMMVTVFKNLFESLAKERTVGKR